MLTFNKLRSTTYDVKYVSFFFVVLASNGKAVIIRFFVYNGNSAYVRTSKRTEGEMGQTPKALKNSLVNNIDYLSIYLSM